MMDRLPEDVQRIILDAVPLRSLLAVAATCRAMRRLVDTVPLRAVACCDNQMWLRRSDHASRVVQLTLKRYSSIPLDVFRNLRSIELRFGRLSVRGLTKLRSPWLHTLVCGTVVTSGTHIFNASSFLNRFPGLRVVRLTCARNVLFRLDEELPDLDVFDVSAGVVSLNVPVCTRYLRLVSPTYVSAVSVHGLEDLDIQCPGILSTAFLSQSDLSGLRRVRFRCRGCPDLSWVPPHADSVLAADVVKVPPTTVAAGSVVVDARLGAILEGDTGQTSGQVRIMVAGALAFVSEALVAAASKHTSKSLRTSHDEPRDPEPRDPEPCG